MSATIHNEPNMTAEQHRERLRTLHDTELMAQELTQQGAIHALSVLISSGCTEDKCIEMINSLRLCSQLIREENQRRGKDSLFEQDQTTFN